MEKYIRDEGVDVAIITVPREVCEDVAKRAIDAGVRGIWNFAPYDLKGPESLNPLYLAMACPNLPAPITMLL